MKENFDNLINKYLDKETDNNDLKTIDNYLKTSEEFRTHFKTGEYVHENLYSIPTHSAPENITETILSRIISTVHVKFKKSYFFRFIIAFILLLIFTSLFVFFSFIPDLGFVQNSEKYVQNFTSYPEQMFSYLTSMFSSEVFKTVSVLAGLVILLSFYLSLNSFKSFKDRLKQY